MLHSFCSLLPPSARRAARRAGPAPLNATPPPPPFQILVGRPTAHRRPRVRRAVRRQRLPHQQRQGGQRLHARLCVVDDAGAGGECMPPAPCLCPHVVQSVQVCASVCAFGRAGGERISCAPLSFDASRPLLLSSDRRRLSLRAHTHRPARWASATSPLAS